MQPVIPLNRRGDLWVSCQGKELPHSLKVPKVTFSARHSSSHATLYNLNHKFFLKSGNFISHLWCNQSDFQVMVLFHPKAILQDEAEFGLQLKGEKPLPIVHLCLEEGRGCLMKPISTEGGLVPTKTHRF